MLLNILLMLCIYYFKLNFIYLFIYLSFIYFLSGFEDGKNGSMKSFFITLDKNFLYRKTTLFEKINSLYLIFITYLLMSLTSSVLILIYTLIYGLISEVGISLNLIPIFFILLSSLIFRLIGEICGSLFYFKN